MNPMVYTSLRTHLPVMLQLLARRPDLEIPWEKSKYRTFRFISVVGSKTKPSTNCVMLSTGRSGAIPDAGSKARPKVLSKDALSPSESHVSPALCAALEKDLHNWGLAAQSKSPIRYSQSGKAHLKNFRYRTFRCKLLLLARRPDFKSLRKDSQSIGCPDSVLLAGSKTRPINRSDS